jgi:hypothetical protein
MPQFIVKHEYNLSFEDFDTVRSRQPYSGLVSLAKAIRSISNSSPELRWPLNDTMQIARQLRDEGIVIVENPAEATLLNKHSYATQREMAGKLSELRKEALI